MDDEHKYDYHNCPFADEIGGVEDNEYCSCCPVCTEKCADDV